MNDIDIEAERILCGEQVHHGTSLAYMQMKKKIQHWHMQMNNNTALTYADGK